MDDVFVPVGPETLAGRLAAAGFVNTEVDVRDYQFRFVTRTPVRDQLGSAESESG
jgi:hypothetical protein